MESRGCGARSTMGRNSAHSNKQLTPQHDRSPPIPSVNERLAFLRPSRELLEYYRKKIAQFDEEHENLMGKLEKYKATYEEQVIIPQCTKKHGRTDVKSSKDGQKRTRSKVTTTISPTIPENYQRDNQTLLLQVEALQSQLQEQTQLAKEQIDALMEDRRIRVEEAQVQHERDKEKIRTLAEKLQKTQNLLYESTRDYLQLKFEGRDIEKVWMAEKDHLLQELDRYSRQRNRCCENETQLLQESPMEREIQRVQSEEIKSLEQQLNQAHRLADMYREQCVTLEDNLARIQEEGDIGQQLFKERSDKTVKRLQLMTQRYEALEKRRAMEVEGFKNDIKLLRQRLKDVEKQLFKVTLGIGPNQDLAILHEVRQSNNQSKMIQGELRKLKAKIYGLENQLRFG
ncbi:coiled-coil domain-containing protein 77 isoform X3 [Hypanus sabinus]|uniref:coiled-coil domain-containing protein 77 isoform X3 n=1 Tax=Hypanus sabinus TaxID=79690 RepID=UPI0028C4E9B2|nr:coiled-coil domain-containing protein 77 isoform X3 [Hypanus sabinus]